MDLIYTNALKVDQGVLSTYAFDLSFGASENDFEMTLGVNQPVLENGAIIYIEGTEYGGTIDGLKTGSDSETVTYTGRTWHGVINSKVIQPDEGENYYIVSGDSNTILSTLIARLGLSDLFAVDEESSGVDIKKYKFHRYCKAYNGIMDMLGDNGAKLKIAWKNRKVVLSAQPVADYTESPVDGDIATLTVEQQRQKVNHLICLGKGNLADREVIHLYVDQFDRIGDTQYYTGLEEYSTTYENANTEDLRSDGIKKLKELRKSDKAEINLSEIDGLAYDIGDIVGATEYKYGISIAEAVTQKIVKINNGVINIEYKTGGSTTSSSSGGSSSGESEGGGGSEGEGDYSDLPIASDTTLGGVKVGSNLKITEDGMLSVITTNEVEQDNTLPITSSAVHVEVGNINTLLSTI